MAEVSAGQPAQSSSTATATESSTGPFSRPDPQPPAALAEAPAEDLSLEQLLALEHKVAQLIEEMVRQFALGYLVLFHKRNYLCFCKRII